MLFFICNNILIEHSASKQWGPYSAASGQGLHFLPTPPPPPKKKDAGIMNVNGEKQ